MVETGVVYGGRAGGPWGTAIASSGSPFFIGWFEVGEEVGMWRELREGGSRQALRGFGCHLWWLECCGDACSDWTAI